MSSLLVFNVPSTSPALSSKSSTRLALPSCHRYQVARQGRRPISVHASAATIEYVDALCYIRMLVEKVSSPALSGTWFGTANATKQHVNVTRRYLHPPP